MYLTAHRVRSATQAEGINSFRHWHGAEFAWPDDASALPETEPGVLDPAAARIAIRPGGNRVRAYLDVLAPDDTPPAAIEQALADLERDLAQRVNPTVFTSGRTTIRLGVELALEPQRELHFQQLAGEIRRLLQIHRPAG